MRKAIIPIMVLVLLVLCVGFIQKTHLESFTMGNATKVIVIDAGHGGVDPGKVGVNEALEKDINLEIAKYLKEYLDQQGLIVMMTRSEDKGLYSEGATNKKREDLEARVALCNKLEADVTVSIHQNSYPEEYCKGAQVFYYVDSTEGKALAQIIQSSLITLVDQGNKRVEKANESYYLLKKTQSPTVIVECGFLSNYQEAQQLVTPEYQKLLAYAIYQGIMNYLDESAK